MTRLDALAALAGTALGVLALRHLAAALTHREHAAHAATVPRPTEAELVAHARMWDELEATLEEEEA